MNTKLKLIEDIKLAKESLLKAEAALEEFNMLPENNVFMDLEDACNSIEETLRNKAFSDCEGAGNCGLSEYSRLFMVNGVTYLGTLKVEYNRHDKTYYYIDEVVFNHKQI